MCVMNYGNLIFVHLSDMLFIGIHYHLHLSIILLYSKFIYISLPDFFSSYTFYYCFLLFFIFSLYGAFIYLSIHSFRLSLKTVQFEWSRRCLSDDTLCSTPTDRPTDLLLLKYFHGIDRGRHEKVPLVGVRLWLYS